MNFRQNSVTIYATLRSYQIAAPRFPKKCKKLQEQKFVMKHLASRLIDEEKSAQTSAHIGRSLVGIPLTFTHTIMRLIKK